MTTVGPHTYVTGDLIKIAGALPAEFNRDGWVVTGTGTDSFTFKIPVYPTASSTAASTYRVVHAPYTRTVSGVSTSGSGTRPCSSRGARATARRTTSVRPRRVPTAATSSSARVSS